MGSPFDAALQQLINAVDAKVGQLMAILQVADQLQSCMVFSRAIHLWPALAELDLFELLKARGIALQLLDK